MQPLSTHDALPDPRNDKILIYIDGELFPRSEAKVSVFDSGFLLGDGVWEGIRLKNGVFAFLDAHLDRLYQSAAAASIDIGMTREEVSRALHHTVNTNEMKDDVHVRLMVTRGLKKTPSQDPLNSVGGPTVVIIPEYKVPNPITHERGIRLFTSTVRRGPPDYLDPRLNCHSKLHEVIALIQARQAGADEALMLDVHGFVSTCNATNFFIVRKGEVWTSTGQYCLQGITRSKVLDICASAEIAAFQKDFSLTDVYDADEAFVTGSFGGLTPVSEVDGRSMRKTVPGPVTERLRALYEAALNAECLSAGSPEH